MNVTINKMGRAVSVAALGLGLLSSAGCDAAKDAACADYSCADKGVADGNFAISGNVAIDSFFKSVVGFGGVANSVSADIKAELDGIQLAFGISDEELASAKGDLGAAMSAKLDSTFKASIKIDAQPAECKVDASVSAQATVDCQASANCEVKPGKATVTCMGKCTAEVSAEGKCDAEAELQCEVSGPSLTCEGECSGSCDVELTAAAKCEGSCTGSCMLDVAAKCEGTCNGTCMGTCSAMNGQGGCEGTCDGMCEGTCELAAGGSCSGMCEGSCKVGGMAALDCSGKCEGSCKAKAPEAGCSGGAKASCDFKADAKVECSGSCDGEFEPPKADCDASASCEASAKADAKFSAKCTPPSVDVTYEFKGAVSADVEAQFKFAISELKVRLPRLFASLKKSDIVLKAGAELGDKGAAAVSATIDAFAEGEVDVSAAFKIGKCVPAQLTASKDVVAKASTGLAAQVSAAGKVTAALGG